MVSEGSLGLDESDSEGVLLGRERVCSGEKDDVSELLAV